MQPVIKLGPEPYPIALVLVRGQDFTQVIEPAPGSGSVSPVYPAGTTVTLAVHPEDTDPDLPFADWEVLQSWPGEIVDDEIWLSAPLEDTDLIPAGALATIRIVYPDSPHQRYVWGKGPVVVQ